MKTNKKAIIWLSSAHFLTDVYSGFLNPVMPFIAAKIGMSMAVATILMSISQVCSSLLQPIFGFFADNIYKRGFIFWGLIFAAIFTPLSVVAPTIWLLALFIILGSLGVSIFHPQAIGFIIRFTKEDYTKSMGVFLSLGSIGYSFGPIVSASITQYLGLESLTIAMIVGVALALVMFLCVPKISNIDKAPKENKDIFTVFKTILTNKQLVILISISIMKALSSSSCAILMPFLWKNSGHDAMYIGIALFCFMFMGGIGSLVSPFFEKHLGTRAVIYISLTVTFPLMLLFVLLYKSHPLLSIITFSLIGFIIMLATPIVMVLAQKVLPQYKSIIGGFLNGFCWGIVGVLMSCIGFLAQEFGILKVLTIVYTIPLFCTIFVKYLKIEEKKI